MRWWNWPRPLDLNRECDPFARSVHGDARPLLRNRFCDLPSRSKVGLTGSICHSSPGRWPKRKPFGPFHVCRRSTIHRCSAAAATWYTLPLVPPQRQSLGWAWAIRLRVPSSLQRRTNERRHRSNLPAHPGCAGGRLDRRRSRCTSGSRKAV